MPHESIDMWERRLVQRAPTTCYCRTVQDYLLIICCFVRGQRACDWPLTLNACTDLCLWFFTFRHKNYVRWMPVFLKDMPCLPEIHPSVHETFVEGSLLCNAVTRSSPSWHSIRARNTASNFWRKIVELSVSMVSKRRKKSLSSPNRKCEGSRRNLKMPVSASNKDVSLDRPESSVAEQKKFLQDLKALLSLLSTREQLSVPSRRQFLSLSHWILVRSWTLTLQAA